MNRYYILFNCEVCKNSSAAVRRYAKIYQNRRLVNLKIVVVVINGARQRFQRWVSDEATILNVANHLQAVLEDC